MLLQSLTKVIAFNFFREPFVKNSNVVMTDHDSTINDINNKRKELLSGLFKTDSMHSEYYEYLLRKM